MAKKKPKRKGVRHVHPKRDTVELVDRETGEPIGRVEFKVERGTHKFTTRWVLPPHVQINFSDAPKTA